MGLKVEMIEINGEKRVPEEVMDLLIRFAHHRDFCEPCRLAYEGKSEVCPVGLGILQELQRQPGVEFTKD